MQDFIPKETDINGQIGDIAVKQYDNLSRFLRVQITDNDTENKLFDISDCSTSLYIEPEGNEDPDAVAYVAGEASYDEENGAVVTFLLPGSVTQAAGRYTCEIWINEGNAANHPIISTSPFTLVVRKSIRNDSAIMASSQFSALDAWATDVQCMKNELSVLVALSESGEFPSGSVESEMVDMRTDHDGVTHASAGDALRSIGAAAENSGVVREIEWYDGYMKIASRDFALETATPGNYHYAEIKLYPGDRISGSVANGSALIAGVAVCEQPHFLHNANFAQELGTTHPETSGDLATYNFSYTATKISTVVISTHKSVAPNITVVRASIDHLIQPPYYPQYKNVPSCTWVEGYFGYSDHTFHAETGDATHDETYHTSNPFYLPSGARLCVKATGSGGCSVLTVWDTSGQFVSAVAGDWNRWDKNYVATANCYVTVSRRIAAVQVDGADVAYFTDSDNSPVIYVNSYLSETPLYGKNLIVIGDSLTHGHTVGNDITWSNLLAMKYGMTVDNQSVNGSTVAVVNGQSTNPMCIRYTDITTVSPDIVVIEGGANDWNNSVPIGMNFDTDTSTFKGALNTLIDGLRMKYPRAVIMMMTTYHRLRRGGDNSMPDELRYSIAMLEVCEYRGIPCYNNMMSGIDLSNANIRAWADEGVWLGGNANYHFSEEAYKRLASQYEKWIESYIAEEAT